MQFTIERLMNQLEQFHPKEVINKADLISVFSVCFFTKNTQYNQDAVLFIGYASELIIDFAIESNIPIVCIEDIPVPEQYCALKNLICLASPSDINKVYEVILTLLQEDAIEKEFMEILYQSVLQEDDICTICDIAKGFIQNPIVVLDNSLKHIAETSETELQDAIWVDQRKNGSYMSADYVQLLAEQVGYKKAVSYTHLTLPTTPYV